MKKFEKVEKTGIISTKFSLLCTPSVILGLHALFEAKSLCSSVLNKKESEKKMYTKIYKVHVFISLFFQRTCDETWIQG